MAVAADADAIGNFAWQIEIDGLVLAQFKEVSGLDAEITVIEQIQNRKGGIPVTTKLPGVTKWGNLTLKRGLSDDASFWNWLKLVQQGKPNYKRGLSIVLYDYDRGEKLRFNVREAWASSVKVSALQAGGSEIVMEEVVLVHSGVEIA